MSVIFSTDQSGANTNICSGQSHTFNFSVSSSQEAYSANFTMKKGSTTSLPVTVTIYSQPNGGGSVIGSSTVIAANITQSFAPIEFLFSGITLSANSSYSLVISSTSSCSGSSPYSFKAGNFQVLNKDTGAVINVGYAISSPMSALVTLGSTARLNSSLGSSPKSSTLLSSSLKKTINPAASLISSFSLSASATREHNASADMLSENSLTATADQAHTAFSQIMLESALFAELSGGKAQYSVRSDMNCESHLDSTVNLSMLASSELNSECAGIFELGKEFLVDASMNSESLLHVSGELEIWASMDAAFCSSLQAVLGDLRRRRRRMGSGHYTINRGHMIRRSWTPFIGASKDNNKSSDTMIALESPQEQ